jgi:phenylalanyl-tRNA synthetase beta chain
VLGIGVDRPEVRRILESLGLEVLGGSDDAITVRPPTWRADLEREIDLIEEVARVHGYEHIPEDSSVPVTSTPRGRRERVESEIRNTLTGLGLDEAVTFSLVEDALAAPVEPGPAASPLRVDHSSRRRENALRQSLIPSLLAARRHNEAHGAADAQLFEIADVYLPREGSELPEEPARLALAVGRDFREAKGVVETLVSRLHLAEPLSARPVESPLFAPGRSAELKVGDVRLGFLGEVDAGQLERFELRGACAAAELDLGVLLDKARLIPQAHPLPSFPAVVRDLSLVVDRSLAWADLAAVVQESAGASFRGIEYLDSFRGGNLADDQQSLHFSLTFRRDDRTLTGEEVDQALKNVVEACSRKFGARLRS